jgi:hypothetical protein
VHFQFLPQFSGTDGKCGRLDLPGKPSHDGGERRDGADYRPKKSLTRADRKSATANKSFLLLFFKKEDFFFLLACAIETAIQGDGQKEECSFLKKRTKKLLILLTRFCCKIRLKYQKFFASFFQKRRPFFVLVGCEAAHPTAFRQV